MLNGSQEAHLSVAASMSQDYVLQVASFWLSTNDQQGLPPEWLIKSNDGCGIMAVGMLTYKLQCGEGACGVTGIHVNHWEKDEG